MAKLSQAELEKLGWREKAQASEDESPGIRPTQVQAVRQVNVQASQRAFPAETLLLSKENAQLRAEVKVLKAQVEKLKNVLAQALMRDQAKGDLLKKTPVKVQARRRVRNPSVHTQEAAPEGQNVSEGVKVVTPEVLPSEDPRPDPEDGWQEALANAGSEDFDGLDADLGLD